MFKRRAPLGEKVELSRRNIVRMGAVLGSLALTEASARAAGCRPMIPCAASCFLKGTRIQIADGDRAVEDLAIGDLLPTMFGGTRPIQWIGHYPIKKSDPAKPWPKDALPIRIAPWALAPGVPHSPLYVTAWHALFIDGLLLPAGMLVNGTTITREEAREHNELEFFHIKLESHDVIYAGGAPVETLLNVDERAVNFADYFRRYGAPTTDSAPCAARVSYSGLDEVKSRMRSAVSPAIDCREQFDVIRDRLEERGLELSRNLEVTI
jgi:hypothetical protein